MNQLIIQELNNLINQEYAIEINCSKSIILDSYNEGELKENYYNPSSYKENRRSKPDSLKKDLREMLNFITTEIIGYGTLEKYYNECFNYSDDDFIVMKQINGDNKEPSAEEVELWKAEDMCLYNEYTQVSVMINGTKIGFELLSKLIESQELSEGVQHG